MGRDRGSLSRLREAFGTRPFRVADAVAQAGVSRTTLHRLRHDGELVGTLRGVLQLTDGGAGMLSDLAAVSARVPDGTICLNSALSYWDLSDEIPEEIHLAIARGAHRPQFTGLRVRVHQFDQATFAVGRQRAETDAGEPFWISSPERTVVDTLRLARWTGRDVGLGALRRYLARPGANPARVSEIARELGVSSRIAPAIETLLS